MRGGAILEGETRKALSGDLNELRENMDCPTSKNPSLYSGLRVSYPLNFNLDVPSPKSLPWSPISGQGPFCGHTGHFM